jgi:hypothetical protein
MKIRIIIIICFAFLNAKSQPVTPIWAWGHNFNGSIAAVEYHNDFIYTATNFSDSAFIFGNTNIPNNGGKDVVIVKWDTLGNLIWATSIYGSAEETIADIKINSNNELVVAVNSNSPTVSAGGNILNNNGSNDIFICKYNLSGINQSNFVIGTAAADYAADMCVDQQNNIYLLYGSLKKYSNAGAFIWQSPIGGSDIYYSQFDSTIVTTSKFLGTISYGNYSVTSAGLNSDFYASKTSMSGNPVWLINTTNSWTTWPGYPDDDLAEVYIDPISGKMFVTTGTFDQPSTYWEIKLKSYSPAGAPGAVLLQTWFDGGPFGPWTISGKDSFVSFSHSGFASGIWGDYGVSAIFIYNTNTNQLVKEYSDVAPGTPSPFLPQGFQLFRGVNSIYTLGYENNSYRTFGKIGHGILEATDPFKTWRFCQAPATGVLTSNIIGGVAPLSYNWQPAIGLNNTNTNTVNFNIANNMTYTLTVTDAIGQIAKDTFELIIDTPILNGFNITSQFPVLCDSMMLYSNVGITGTWYKRIGNGPGFTPLGNLIEDVMIHSPGHYRFQFSYGCGVAYDSIDIQSAIIVNANTTSDTICSGQNITLYGSGAVSYAWSGGVQNNIPFAPLSTQTYTLTGTDANGCFGTSTVKVTVLPAGSSSTALSICTNQTPYMWNGQSLAATGTYTANFIMPNGCDSVATLILSVSPCIVCVPNFTINYSPFYNSLTESQSWITTSGTVLILAGDKVKLDANANSYVSLNPGFKADSGSVFVAQAYNGCTAGAPQLPNAKIYNGETYLSAAADEIVLYPNPTSGFIHIKHDEKITDIQIFDMVGKLAINQKCNGETETNIDLSNLPNGVYHVKAMGYNSVKVVKNE